MSFMKIGCKEFNFGSCTYIMGILNVTPDSFFDGGSHETVDFAVSFARQMVCEGVDIIDVGGESSRPGHLAVSLEEELERVIPVITAVHAAFPEVPISVDTAKAVVAEAAVKAGASMLNDIWGFRGDSEMARVAAKYDVTCCLMHNRQETVYEDLMAEVCNDLMASVQVALAAGVQHERIVLDPGIGFGKTKDQNIEVLRQLEKIKALGFPVLLGTSRKSFIGLTLNLPVEERLEGTLTTTALGIGKGVDIVRVHDVKENVRVCRMADALVR